ncbi:hypothetical protein LGK97_08695 [Clostridium sp. CS001]|uniref:Nmad3 family putative nucleotide modification protein n=1 Tax=Clostridium sp. CS001 TaxID=2880648 RepID=UPI001CF3CC9D|nr:hypothetical protein [Clostridium sp. CS001]MCB2289841.1 hypothetical protein [Clostridium sp. CS001]
MKIILSRKGFDSAAGGYPSPLFIDEKFHVSLPIPEDINGNAFDTGITYSDIYFKDGNTYAEVMNSLGIKGFENRYVHLDPDLNYNVTRSRANNWKGIFGQCSTSQSHLSNQRVEEGDLFLFFGWFKDVKRINGRYTFVNKTDKQIIWGYLQVGKIESILENENYCEWKLNHPHYYDRNRIKNTAYIANEKLSFNENMPGYGCLSYSEDLVLTCSGQTNRSMWMLPKYFHPSFNTKMTFHEKLKSPKGKPIWQFKNDCCLLQTVGRGQEFVISGNTDVEEWAKIIIGNNV